MKKQKKNILLILIISAFLCTMIFSYAKYISNSVIDYYLKSKGFYFYSDYLNTSVVNNANNNWDGESVHFNIKNSLNDNVVTDYDINYTATCSIEGDASSHAICNMNGLETNTYSGTMSVVKSCKTHTADNVDVSAFTKSECELGGYSYESEVKKTNLYFDIVLTDSEYELNNLKVDVSVTSTSPYGKTLRGVFLLHKVDNTSTVIIKSDDYGNYNRLSFYNSSLDDKCIQVSFDTNKFLVDGNQANFLEDTSGYITSFKQIISSNESKSFIFYKKDFEASYSINDFLISTSCTIN